LPEQTLAVFCYHVGQLDDTEDRDPRYQGRGIGLRLLDVLLDWATQAGFAALVAKAVPTPRPIMAFMGGQTTKAYQERGFQPVASWVDAELKTLVADRRLVPSDMSPDEAARVSCVVRRLG
jgi:GNAT superfamily N-acetyltransferase